MAARAEARGSGALLWDGHRKSGSEKPVDRCVVCLEGLYLRKIPERISARPRPIPRKAPP